MPRATAARAQPKPCGSDNKTVICTECTDALHMKDMNAFNPLIRDMPCDAAAKFVWDCDKVLMPRNFPPTVMNYQLLKQARGVAVVPRRTAAVRLDAYDQHCPAG